MFKKKGTTLLDIWRQMWFAALILYVSYFFYRWIGVFVANIIGAVADVLLYQDNMVVDTSLLGKLILAFGFALLIMPTIDLITNVMLFRRSLAYEKRLVQSVFEKKYETIQNWKSSEWIGRISKDSIEYRQMAVVTPTRIAADTTVLLIAVFSLLRINVFLTVVFLVGLLASIGLHFWYKRENNLLLKKTRDYQNEKRQHQIELVHGHALWKNLACEKAITKRMRDLYQKFWKNTQKKDILIAANLELFPKTIIMALFTFSLYYGAEQVLSEKMRAGDFVVVYLLVLQIRTMLESILNNLQIMRGYSAQEQRINELLKKETPTGNIQIRGWERLHFEKVSYSYPESQEGMCERTFEIKRNALAEIEGNNGSGKTTLIKILCGLFESKNKEIMLDDMSLSEIDLAQWQSKIGYMQQFPDILPGTVRENVHVGNLAANYKQVEEVLNKVGLVQFSDRPLNGLKDELSGGEMKKIQLARILLRLEQCELIILDEPYEGMDETGRNLVKEILGLTNKTRILISHSC